MNKKKRSIVTIGVFDGVHIGHRAVIKRTVDRAKAVGAISIVVTFDPHPLKVLGGKHLAPSLMSLKHRVNAIRGLGAEKVIVMKFDKRLSMMEPGHFIENIIRKKLNAAEIFIGEDFRFGKGAGADIKDLRRIGTRAGLKVHPVKAVKRGGRIVSSSEIRRLIVSGKTKEASGLLGRPFSILGTVVPGARLARALGYPTANINPHHEAMPPSGVYAVMVKFNKKLFKGVMNIGVRPTFYDHGRDVEPSIEVHIFGFRGNIYGKDLEIVFVNRMRAEKKFNTIDSLIEQVKDDVSQAENFLIG
ncbi:MAG: bifunctional riboflavin kinase/FAD synthetase [Candidatus Omnitrophota bacterium]|nr:bifunctional riboflavin kinase/FAD synthetase [Candidatus Omnitrophota bacterium]